MSKGYDVVVVGGGHNALVCAAYLARAGKKVLVAEARAALGGLAYGGEIHPGFRSPGPLADASRFRRKIIDELSLHRYGLEVGSGPPATVVAGAGKRIVLSRDLAATRASIAEVSKDDAERFADFRAFVDAIASVVGAFTDRAPLDLMHIESEAKLELVKRALGVRRLGRARMLELFRVAPMSAADWVGEFFQSGLLKAGLVLPGIAQTYAPPRAPGTATNVILAQSGEELAVQGGASAVTRALSKACADLGVAVTTGRAVASIVTTAYRATGVRFADGEEVSAEAVVCAGDPKTALLSLTPRAVLPARTEQRMASWRTRGIVAHLAVAVDAEIELEAGASRLIVADDLDDIERAFDAVKYRQCSERPVLDVSVATARSGAAPKGGSVLSIRVHYAPTEHADGYSDAVREQLEAAAMARLAEVVPEVATHRLASRLWCPPDLAREYHLAGGHLEHGEMALDQILVRPVPECGGYRTPVDGMFLASSGSHPGAGFTGLPGALAARAILA